MPGPFPRAIGRLGKVWKPRLPSNTSPKQMGPSSDHTQELPHRWVSFHMPEGGDAMTKRKEPVTKPTIKDLEAWLEHQVGKLGIPAWWRELEAVLDMEDTCKLTQKIWPSFYVPEIQSRTNPGQPFSHPQPPGTSTEELSIPKDWNIRTSGKDPPFSLWPTADVYSIGQRSITCQ